MARRFKPWRGRALALAIALSVVPSLWLSIAPGASAETSSIFGTWYTQGRESQVRLYACGAALCGDIVALKSPNNPDGTPLHDTKNKDEALRGQPILGLQILRDFERDSESRWEDGWGYDPEDGYAYDDVQIEQTGPDELEIGGCILWGAICKTQTWERVVP